MKEPTSLMTQLDRSLGFPNKIESRIRKLQQGFDQSRNEHVFLIEYRVRVDPGAARPSRRIPRRKSPAVKRYKREESHSPGPDRSRVVEGLLRELAGLMPPDQIVLDR
ncbi:MAG: hypothetical protein Q7J29_02625 [Stagnimonas sp.]|nr:hypothetical protein [Stagnimonas sp.]